MPHGSAPHLPCVFSCCSHAGAETHLSRSFSAMQGQSQGHRPGERGARTPLQASNSWGDPSSHATCLPAVVAALLGLAVALLGGAALQLGRRTRIRVVRQLAVADNTPHYS